MESLKLSRPFIVRLARMVCALAILLCVMSFFPSSVLAKDDEPPSATGDTVPSEHPTSSTPQTSPTNNGGGGDIIRQITQIFHIVDFTNPTLEKGVGTITLEVTKTAAEIIAKISSNAMDATIFKKYGFLSQDKTLFKELVFGFWKISAGAAAGLLPLTLMFTIILAMRNGLTSVTGFADLKESLMAWFIGAVMVASSYFLLELFHRLSLEISLFFIRDVTAAALVKVVINIGSLNSLIVNASTGLSQFGGMIAGVVIFLIATLLAIFTFASILLAGAAYIALVTLLSVMAPLVIVVGTIPALRWMWTTWSKAIAIVLMAGPVNAILLALGVKITAEIGQISMGAWIGSGLVLLAVASLLCTINYKIGEFAFGAVMEIGKGVISDALKVAGAGVGLIAAGAGIPAAGAMLSGLQNPGANSGTSPALPPLGGSSSGGNAGGSGNSGSSGSASLPSANDPARKLQQAQAKSAGARLATAAGRSLAMSFRNNPLFAGLGAGLTVGGEAAGVQASMEASSAKEQQDAGRSAEQATRYKRQEHRRVIDKMYDQNGNRTSFPPHIYHPNYDPSGLFAAQIQRDIPTASEESAYNLGGQLSNRINQANFEPNVASAAKQGVFRAINQPIANTDPNGLATQLGRWNESNGDRINLDGIVSRTDDGRFIAEQPIRDLYASNRSPETLADDIRQSERTA